MAPAGLASNPAEGGVSLDANWVVLGVAMLAWGLLFYYLVRLDRRIKELEKQ